MKTWFQKAQAWPRRRLQRHFFKAASAGLVLLGALGLSSLAACEGKNRAVAFHSVDITGADYGKDFALPDVSGANGVMRRLADFKGQVVLLFFGYTQCPDVCPTTLSELATVKRALGAQGERLQVVFISLDPERDTREVLAAYVHNFDPHFVALRADTPEQLAAVAKEFKIFYKKVPGKTPSSYTLDHSAGHYIFDPQGRLRLYARYNSGAVELREDIQQLLASAS